jgi:hypothetical protein
VSECVSSIGFEVSPGPGGDWAWHAEAELAVLVAESVARTVSEWTWTDTGANAREGTLAYGAAAALLQAADLLPPTANVRLDLAGCIQDDGSIEKFSGLAAAFAPGPGPPAPGPPAELAKLGCGHYEAALFERGGRRMLGMIPWTSLSWGRDYCATSQAEYALNGVAGAGEECCGLLALAKPWKHELHIFRDNRTVWSGPLVQKRIAADTASLVARDLTAWWDRRRIHHTHDFSGNPSSDNPYGGEFVDLAIMFQAYSDDGMSVDNTPGLCVTLTPTGVLAERNVLARSHIMVGDILRELTRAGINWTVVNRTVYAAVPPLMLPTLTDDSFVQPPTVVTDGLQQENDAGVRGAGTAANGDALWAAAVDAPSVVEFGRLEKATTEAGLENIIDVRAAAAERLAVLKEPVSSIEEGTLDPETGVLIADLVPGALVPVRLIRTCDPVLDTYRLTGLRVQVAASETGATEDVGVTFQPVGPLSDDEAGL